jgi:putative transposase
MTGAKVVIVDLWLPSSETCSAFGTIHDMPLSKRTMDCGCGNTMDRDLNAAINLRNYAMSITVSVCEAASSAVMQSGDVKRAAVKQELSAKPVCTGLGRS